MCAAISHIISECEGQQYFGKLQAHVFPNADEGKCSDRSGCLRVGGASQAAIGTVELTVPHRLWPRKKKKSLQLYVQGLLLFAAVCYNTVWQPPGPLCLPPRRAWSQST